MANSPVLTTASSALIAWLAETACGQAIHARLTGLVRDAVQG